MAKTKEITITSIDSLWEGPIKNGDYTNYECDGTMKGMKGDEPVRVIVGSDKMTEKFEVGEKYVGGFVGKTDDGRWKVAFLAKNNPSLSSSQEGYSGGSSESAPKQENRNKAFATSYVKDIACASVGAGNMYAEDAIDFVTEHAPVFELFLDGKVRQGETAEDVQEPEMPEPSREVIGEVIKRHDLVRKVGDAGINLENLSDIWSRSSSENDFVKKLKDEVLDDAIPF